MEEVPKRGEEGEQSVKGKLEGRKKTALGQKKREKRRLGERREERENRSKQTGKAREWDGLRREKKRGTCLGRKNEGA